MANVIKLHKGLTVNLKGKAGDNVLNVAAPEKFALVPDNFHGMKPKVVVKEGDSVKAGDALFVDKAHPEVKFVSPVSGTVEAVVRGDRRKLLRVEIKSDGKNASRDFGKQDVNKMSSEQVKALLLDSGLFAFFRSRPFDVVANPEEQPKSIFVSAFNDMPLAQDFEIALRGNEKYFQSGISALARIARVNLGVSKQQTSKALNECNDAIVTIFDGKSPAGNVGVQINNVDPINKGEVVWTMGAEEVIWVGRLVETGIVDMTRTIAVAGSEIKTPGYAKVTVGQCICTLLKEQIDNNKSLRIIGGNVMTGLKLQNPDFLPAHATEINVIPEGDDIHEMLGWIMPRFNTFSTHRSYFSWLCGKKEYAIDARVKGGERHMIMSGEYERVLPMDIMAEQLIKAIIAGDIDRMEALGIYEVAPEDFALCEFVDSSKLELQHIVRKGLDMLQKEMA